MLCRLRRHLLASGDLVEVLLPAWRPVPLHISFLYRAERERSRRLLAFVEWFEGMMGPCLDARCLLEG